MTDVKADQLQIEQAGSRKVCDIDAAKVNAPMRPPGEEAYGPLAPDSDAVDVASKIVTI